jgi:branched-chain amino acid transport system substrate-binding protein
MPQITISPAWGTAIMLAFWAQTASAQIKIGLSIPLTGPLAVFGQAAYSGARLAVGTINAQDGINGTHLELITEDVDCRPDLGANSARKLVQLDHVSALMGYTCASVSVAASRVAAESDVVLLTLSTSAPITPDTRTTLRMIGRDDNLARTSADYVAANFRNKQIGLWSGNQPSTFDSALTNELQSQSIKLKQSESAIGPGNEPPTWISGVDVLLISPTIPSSIDLQLPQRFPSTTFVAPRPILTPDLADTSRPRNLAVISNPAPNYFPGAVEVARRAGYQQPLSSTYAIYAYTAVQVFVAAARKTNLNFSGTALVTAAKSQPIPTAIGQLQYDDRGEIKNWKFAIYVESSDPDVCKSPQCRNYQQCLPCPN